MSCQKILPRNRAQAGFSLIELMVVVAIIGIIAALAVPRFMAFEARAKAVEATTSVGLAYTLQVAYHGDNDTYGSLAAIGFQLNGLQATGDTFAAAPTSKIRYTYTSAGYDNKVFDVGALAAAGTLGSCQNADHTVHVNQNKAITPTADTTATTSASIPVPGC